MFSVRARRALVFVFATAVACGSACSIYNSSLLAPAIDAGVDSAAPPVDAAVPDANSCVHSEPPPTPTTEDGPSTVDFTLAASYLRFFTTPEAVTHPVAPTSFDLDGVCTCPGPESCTPLSTMKHCDGDGGADDAVGSLFETFAQIDPAFSDVGVNNNITGGFYSVLFRVRSYNGTLNDPQVTLIIYTSPGLSSHVDGGSSGPLFDGTDVWTVDPNSLLGGTTVDGGPSCEGNDSVCVPIYADTAAYVSNGTVVGHLNFPILVGGGTSQILATLTSSIITMPLISSNGTYRVDDGQVSARWSTRGILTSLQAASDPLSAGGYLCGDSGTYQQIKQRVCSAADLESLPTNDNSNLPCDALSIGLSFSATPAHIGQIYSRAPGAPPCGVGYSDDCTQ